MKVDPELICHNLSLIITKTGAPLSPYFHYAHHELSLITCFTHLAVVFPLSKRNLLTHESRNSRRS